jgi:predicted ester cyclase
MAGLSEPRKLYLLCTIKPTNMKSFFVVSIMVLSLIACNDSSTKHASTASNDSFNNPAASSTSNSEEAKEERNKQTALASVRGFSTGDVDVILKDWHSGVVDYGDGSMPPIKGLDSAKTGLRTWIGGIKDFNVSDLVAVADGDLVMVYGTWRGTWKGDIMGMKATGKSFKANDVDIFKFNDSGKIVEHRGVQSMNELARQLGMKMPTQ